MTPAALTARALPAEDRSPLEIRPAILADVPHLVVMGERMLQATYAGLLVGDPAALAQVATDLVLGPASTVLVAARADTLVGMIGLVCYPHPFSATPTAGEIMWWVEPDARGIGAALLARAERWAAERGAATLQMIAPASNPRVGTLYTRRGYAPVETTYQRPIAAHLAGVTVCDDVLPDAAAYRAASRAQPVAAVEPAPGVVFPGIGAPVDDRLPQWIAARWPALTPTQSFLRRSERGSPQPTYIHTDVDMGDWTAIYYLTDAPPAGDGTTFWRQRATGALLSLARTEAALATERAAWRDPAQWVPWRTVAARPNRLVLFPAAYFHSRALPDNYGTGDTARLIHVVFGTGPV
jgi:GNAT superfamily N-acetyltransferase